jgi:hypothetical protein
LPSGRFPPPWSVDELDACFVVKDIAGQKLAYVCYEEGSGRIGGQATPQRRGAADRMQARTVMDLDTLILLGIRPMKMIWIALCFGGIGMMLAMLIGAVRSVAFLSLSTRDEARRIAVNFMIDGFLGAPQRGLPI